jgi:hypothetical protein
MPVRFWPNLSCSRTCTGVLSSCFIGGYALESRCHLGRTILYDTAGKLHWSVDVRTHRIGVLIDQVLNNDWDDGEGGPPVPKAQPEDDCVVRGFFLLLPAVLVLTQPCSARNAILGNTAILLIHPLLSLAHKRLAFQHQPFPVCNHLYKLLAKSAHTACS